MGQYRQWLHYRDIDRHLHTQREKLIQEITYLQEQVQRLEMTYQEGDNSLVQALLQQRPMQFVQPATSSTSPTPVLNNVQPDRVREETGQYVSNPQTPVPSMSPMYPSLPPLPHPIHAQNQDEDIPAPTDPQITIPQWLLRATSASPSGPLDSQGIQTNRLVQRWLERWGKQLPEQVEQSQEPQNGTSLNQHQSNSINSINSITHEDTGL